MKTRSGKLKLHRVNSQMISYPIRFSTDIILFSSLVSFFIFLLFLLFVFKLEISILIHIRLWGWVSDFHRAYFWKQDYFFWLYAIMSEVRSIWSFWIHFNLFVKCSIHNTISLFTPCKFESIKWFRDGFWDICSTSDWYLFELTFWFQRKI